MHNPGEIFFISSYMHSGGEKDSLGGNNVKKVPKNGEYGV